MLQTAAILPTYSRGARCIPTIARILACDPPPREIIVHVDQSDGSLEETLSAKFPAVRVLSSSTRLGPGGGRHQCLTQCTTDFAASFDDDSFPIDDDYFLRAEEAFNSRSDAGVIGATIWHRNQSTIPRKRSLVRRQSYVGCGCIFRLSAYRETRGLLPRPVPYGGEETDLSLLLFEKGWKIYQSGDLRVFHDTELTHHTNPEITAGTIANIGLFAFLHYPIALWPLGTLQVANMIRFCVMKRRWRGILPGLFSIPRECLRYSYLRRPLPAGTIREYRAVR
jgi:GT2 family glycosyltransferase